MQRADKKTRGIQNMGENNDMFAEECQDLHEERRIEAAQTGYHSTDNVRHISDPLEYIVFTTTMIIGQ